MPSGKEIDFQRVIQFLEKEGCAVLDGVCAGFLRDMAVVTAPIYKTVFEWFVLEDFLHRGFVLPLGNCF